MAENSLNILDTHFRKNNGGKSDNFCDKMTDGLTKRDVKDQSVGPTIKLKVPYNKPCLKVPYRNMTS